MMMDGVPDARAGVRLLSLSGASTQQRGGDRRPAGASRGHQVKCGQGTRTTHLSGHPLFFADRHRQGAIAELTQGVIAAAQDFALHRQGRVLAVVASVFGGQPLVLGVIGRPVAGRALRRIHAQLFHQGCPPIKAPGQESNLPAGSQQTT
jgi:hypothetical protein